MLYKIIEFYEKSMPYLFVITAVCLVLNIYLSWLVKRISSPESMLKTYRNRIRKYGYEGIEMYIIEYAKERADECLALPERDWNGVSDLSDLKPCEQLRFFIDNIGKAIFTVKKLTNNYDEIAEATIGFDIEDSQKVSGDIIIRMRYAQKRCEWDITYLNLLINKRVSR